MMVVVDDAGWKGKMEIIVIGKKKKKKKKKKNKIMN